MKNIFWNVLAFFVLFNASRNTVENFQHEQYAIGMLYVCVCISALFVICERLKNVAKEINDSDDDDDDFGIKQGT